MKTMKLVGRALIAALLVFLSPAWAVQTGTAKTQAQLYDSFCDQCGQPQNLSIRNLIASVVFNTTGGSAIITGGSIDGTPIGATTPSTGAFTTLSSTTTALMPDGTKLSPGWQWNSDNDGTGTGHYRRAANVDTTAANGVDTMEVGATRLNLNSGVCIGWSSSATTVNAMVTQMCARTGGIVSSGTTAMEASYTQTTPPTCSSGCGTSPTVVGSDTAGIVTMGATGTPAASWVVTFNGTWTAAPACFVISALGTMAVTKLPISVQTTQTTMSINNNSAAPANSDIYAYHCFGVA